MAMESREFPVDLVEKILCRVPTKFLLRFQLTCKSWHALLREKPFIYEHLPHQQEQIIRVVDNVVTIIDPVMGAHSSLSFPQEFQQRECQGRPVRMIHCDGLLLCILESGSIAVWNPYLNQVRLIKSKPFLPVLSFFGFGYDGDSYVILMLGNCTYRNNLDPKTGLYDQEVNSYHVNSGAWKSFTVLMDWHVILPFKSVSVKDNVYCIAARNHRSHIQCYKVSSETFTEVCSLPFDYDATDVVALSTFRADDLSLIYKSEETEKLEIWVTKKVMQGVGISWTKFFSVTFDLPDPLIAPLVIFTDMKNRLVLCCEELSEDESNIAVNVHLIRESENAGQVEMDQVEIDRHQVDIRWPLVESCVYRPSLVPVPTLEEDQPN